MSSPASETPVTPDLFRPTVIRCLLTLGIAAVAFCVPQAIPLEYFPLNNPSSGLQYLEITCASNITTRTEVFLDTGKGFNELEKIEWPIGPSEMAFTYTFPLPDAPLFNLRLDPITNGAGELKITNFRIINRRDEEIRRFHRADLVALHQIDAITPLDKGFRILIKQSDDPYLQVSLGRPLIAEGMNERNLKRCLLSVGYLTLMLWIILLAVYFAFRGREPVRDTLKSIGFLLLLSLMFSFVGNRGLVRNSVRYAQMAATVAASH